MTTRNLAFIYGRQPLIAMQSAIFPAYLSARPKKDQTTDNVDQ
jgi:hypothetical protein